MGKDNCKTRLEEFTFLEFGVTYIVGLTVVLLSFICMLFEENERKLKCTVQSGAT